MFGQCVSRRCYCSFGLRPFDGALHARRQHRRPHVCLYGLGVHMSRHVAHRRSNFLGACRMRRSCICVWEVVRSARRSRCAGLRCQRGEVLATWCFRIWARDFFGLPSMCGWRCRALQAVIFLVGACAGCEDGCCLRSRWKLWGVISGMQEPAVPNKCHVHRVQWLFCTSGRRGQTKRIDHMPSLCRVARRPVSLSEIDFRAPNSR